MECLNPNIVMPPSNVREAYVTDLYMKEKSKVKQEFATISNRICLTFDLWESYTTEIYLCLTAHLVDCSPDILLKSKLCVLRPSNGQKKRSFWFTPNN
jgi:hypothetical protein